MERNEKAIAVAEDVLKQLPNLKLRRSNAYLFGNIPELRGVSGDVQEHIEKVQANCQVCLLGACLLSKARLYDGVPLESIRRNDESSYYNFNISGEDIKQLLADVFPIKESECIEAAFEGSSGLEDFDTDEELLERAVYFGNQFSGVDERVRQVMYNIIENNGHFIPPAIPVEASV